MNRTLFFLLGGMMLAVAGGCSGSDDEDTTPADNGRKVRQLTITQEGTRATLTEAGGELSASWIAEDKLTYFNMARLYNYASEQYYYATGTLEAATSTPSSVFIGSVDCGNGDRLAVVYPTTTFTEPAIIDGNATYSITLSGQDGTLDKLQSTYHYVYGVASVTSVTETTANATMPKMKSLLAVCKFSFVFNSTSIPVKDLTISYGAEGLDGKAGTYPQTATVTCNTTQADVHATGVSCDSPLTVTLSSATTEAIYVALLPTGGSRTFNFTVNDGSGNTYTGTATATLNEGEYVDATGIKLTKQ
jgi:hypothetical protein